MRHTVKQLADAAGVTARTLHYYHHIGLLKPASVEKHGYRYHSEKHALCLRQILLSRELDLSLREIRSILDTPGFAAELALRSHRRPLQGQVQRVQELIATIDRTIRHTQGSREMSVREMFAGFDEETQRRYEEEASRRWGEKQVKESRRRWDSYSNEKQAAILAEGGEVYQELVARLGEGPASGRVQEAIGRWHQNLRCFYEPTPEILRGLGQAYSQDPRFRATFSRMHPDLPDFLTAAITLYCRRMSPTG